MPRPSRRSGASFCARFSQLQLLLRTSHMQQALQDARCCQSGLVRRPPALQTLGRNTSPMHYSGHSCTLPFAQHPYHFAHLRAHRLRTQKSLPLGNAGLSCKRQAALILKHAINCMRPNGQPDTCPARNSEAPCSGSVKASPGILCDLTEAETNKRQHTLRKALQRHQGTSTTFYVEASPAPGWFAP